MKTLKQFISEQLNESKSNTFKFDFTGIDGVEEIIKSIEDFDGLIDIDDNIVTITLSDNTLPKLTPVKDILNQAITAQRNGTRSTNDEQYAQKVASLENTMKNFENAIAAIQQDNSDEKTPDADKAAENDAEKNEDKKDDDK